MQKEPHPLPPPRPLVANASHYSRGLPSIPTNPMDDRSSGSQLLVILIISHLIDNASHYAGLTLGMTLATCACVCSLCIGSNDPSLTITLVVTNTLEPIIPLFVFTLWLLATVLRFPACDHRFSISLIQRRNQSDG